MLGSVVRAALLLGAASAALATTSIAREWDQTVASDPTPTPTATPPRPLPDVHGGVLRVDLQTIASGLAAPVDLVTANDGTNRLFVVGQRGVVTIIKDQQKLATPFLDVAARLVPLRTSYDERGLLGLAFHPGFNDPTSAGFRKLYTYTSEPVSGSADFTVPSPEGFDHQNVIAEWRVSESNPDVVDPASRREIMRIDWPQPSHNAGKIAFRLSDGMLYIALGDGGGGNDLGSGHNPATGNGQDITTVLGKILRIDPLDPAVTSADRGSVSANGRYRVPASNPFVGEAGVPEIYAYGFRNPFRFSFDRVTDKLIVGDVGQNTAEEIDVVEAGKNYGWHRKEGTFLFNPADGSVSPDPSPDPSLVDPIAEYGHQDGTAVLGGYVYRGSALPALIGRYVFADFTKSFSAPGGRLFFLDSVGPNAVQELHLGNDDHPLGSFIKALGADEAGEIYILTDTKVPPSGATGSVLKIVPPAADPALLNLSTRAQVGSGDNVLIGGFVVVGSTSKPVVLRGIGPSLHDGAQSIAGRLADPFLELHDSSGAVVAENDDWGMSPQKQRIIDSGLAPSDEKESAIFAALNPGAYTAILRSAAGAEGIGVVELYDVGRSAPANAMNISARGEVKTADGVMIGGFIIGGTQSRTLVVRALGPSLSGAGIAAPLANPALALHDSSGTLLASNDDWQTSQEQQLEATGLAPENPNESAILTTLVPGSYTAVVSGVGESSGVAIVEVYQVD